MERTKARTDREAIRDGEQVVETTGTVQSTNTVSKLFKMAGEPCKPESSSTSVFSITSVESINAICQRSQFGQQKQVLCHSYGTVFCGCTLPRTSTEKRVFHPSGLLPDCS